MYISHMCLFLNRTLIYICIYRICAFFWIERSSNLKIFALSSFDFGEVVGCEWYYVQTYGKIGQASKTKKLASIFLFAGQKGNFSEKLGVENLKDSGKTVYLFRDEHVLAHVEKKANSKAEWASEIASERWNVWVETLGLVKNEYGLVSRSHHNRLTKE